jgi:hypothetical protein
VGSKIKDNNKKHKRKECLEIGAWVLHVKQLSMKSRFFIFFISCLSRFFIVLFGSLISFWSAKIGRVWFVSDLRFGIDWPWIHLRLDFDF